MGAAAERWTFPAWGALTSYSGLCRELQRGLRGNGAVYSALRRRTATVGRTLSPPYEITNPANLPVVVSGAVWHFWLIITIKQNVRMPPSHLISPAVLPHIRASARNMRSARPARLSSDEANSTVLRRYRLGSSLGQPWCCRLERTLAACPASAQPGPRPVSRSPFADICIASFLISFPFFPSFLIIVFPSLSRFFFSLLYFGVGFLIQIRPFLTLIYTDTAFTNFLPIYFSPNPNLVDRNSIHILQISQQ